MNPVLWLIECGLPPTPGFTGCTVPNECLFRTHQVESCFTEIQLKLQPHIVQATTVLIYVGLWVRNQVTRQSLPSNSTLLIHKRTPLIITIIITDRQAQLIIWSCIFQDAHTFPIPCTNPSPRMAILSCRPPDSQCPLALSSANWEHNTMYTSTLQLSTYQEHSYSEFFPVVQGSSFYHRPIHFP